MLSKQDQLTELVRKLETTDHVFATDPLLVTERLQDEQATDIQKLHRRAERIDSNGVLGSTLNKIDGRIKGIILTMSILWCVSGFLGLFTLLQSNVVNFFYVLVCLLGFHTLMLVGWLIFTIINRGSQSPSIITSFISPKSLIRGKDDVTQAAVNLYDQQLQHTGMRWYLSKFSHQLWLATLTGMLGAIIFLLIVRQYSFSWESTLLSDQTLMALTHWLGWLPSLVGFNVPDAEAVIQSRLATEAMPLSIARQWASLLVGSLLMYGIVPRALAWAFCALMFNRKQMKLDLSLPYYQKILNFWKRKVVDEDDFVEKVQPVAPKAKITEGNKLVALLEYKHTNPNWYHAAGDAFISQTPENFGILDDRDDMDRMLAYLEDHDVQVLLGVHAKALPDRGTMRKLDKLATHAKQGVIVLLLSDSEGLEAEDSPRRQQWQTALAERDIGLVS